jgi:hypothetical protein
MRSGLKVYVKLNFGLKLVEERAIRPEHDGDAAPFPDPQPLMQEEKR